LKCIFISKIKQFSRKAKLELSFFAYKIKRQAQFISNHHAKKQILA